MKITKLKLSPYSYKIVYKEGGKVFEENGKTFFGLWEQGEQVISINTKYTAQRQKATIIHEILHAVDGDNEIGLKERQVSALANILLRTFQDNKELVRYLLE